MKAKDRSRDVRSKYEAARTPHQPQTSIIKQLLSLHLPSSFHLVLSSFSHGPPADWTISSSPPRFDIDIADIACLTGSYKDFSGLSCIINLSLYSILPL